MTEYERGLLTAAAEARRRAEDYGMRANTADIKGHIRPERGLRKKSAVLTTFAEWCEVEANTYVGASKVLVVR